MRKEGGSKWRRYMSKRRVRELNNQIHPKAMELNIKATKLISKVKNKLIL